MQIESLDHLVLTVKDIPSTVDFYLTVLGMQVVNFGEQRIALRFGDQKINLHQAGQEHEPKAQQPLPGSADLCFITNTPITAVVQHLTDCGVDIITGPVQRTGANGLLLSVYCRDPDLNLLEIANKISPNP